MSDFDFYIFLVILLPPFCCCRKRHKLIGVWLIKYRRSTRLTSTLPCLLLVALILSETTHERKSKEVCTEIIYFNFFFFFSFLSDCLFRVHLINVCIWLSFISYQYSNIQSFISNKKQNKILLFSYNDLNCHRNFKLRAHWLCEVYKKIAFNQ